MNVSPKVIHQVSEAFPYMRVKTKLKNPRSTLGKSIKEILNRAGKRQISHSKQNQAYDNDESASESRRSSVRINDILNFQNKLIRNNSNSNLILESISEEVEDQLFNESPIKKADNNNISELLPSNDQLQLEDIVEEKSESNTSITSTNTKNYYSYFEEEDSFEFDPEFDYYKPRPPYEKPKKGSKRVKRKPNPAFIEEQIELNTGIEIEYEYSYEEEDKTDVFFLGIPKDGIFASDDDHRGFRVSKYRKLNRYDADPEKYQVISTMNHPSRLDESVLSKETDLFEFNHIFDSEPDKMSPYTPKNKSRFIISSSSDDEPDVKHDKSTKIRKDKNNTPKISKSTTKISHKENNQHSTPKTTPKKEEHSKSSPWKRKFLDNSSSDDDNFRTTPRVKKDNAKYAYNHNNKFLKGID